jgi:hypothetical protein
MCIDLAILIIDLIITPQPRCTDLHLSERVNRAQAQTRELRRPIRADMQTEVHAVISTNYGAVLRHEQSCSHTLFINGRT